MTASSRISTCVALALCTLSTQPVFADTLTQTGFTHGYIISTITSPISVTAYTGAFKMQDGPDPLNTFEAWCVDIYHELAPADYKLVDAVTRLTAAKVGALERLATNHLAAVSSGGTYSGAFQMAVWELAFETDSTHQLGLGSFKVQSTDTLAVSLAQQWLDANPTEANTKVAKIWAPITTGASQDLLVFSVPEPETWAMMLAGLGLMGFCANRRKI